MSRLDGEGWQVLARGPWPRDAVRSRLDGAPLALSPEGQALVERGWREALERAKAAGITLFPGEVAGLVSFEASPRELSLHLRATDYRAFVGTNLSPLYRASLGPGAPLSGALGISLIVRTGDLVLLHRRGKGCFEWPLAVDTPGGHVEPTRHRDEGGFPSPFLAALDELEAELGIRPDEVQELSALALVRIEATEKPQLVIGARVSVGVPDVVERLRTARESFETSELLPTTLADLARVVASPERVTPAGCAAMTLATELWGGGGS